MRCRYFTIQKFEEYFLLFIGVASVNFKLEGHPQFVSHFLIIFLDYSNVYRR